MTYSGLYPARERLIERRSHLENHRACPRQWFVVDESKASRPNHTSKRMFDTCRGLAGNAITFRGESIERNAHRGNRPIDFMTARENQGAASRGRRNRVSLPLPIANNAMIRTRGTLSAMARRNFKPTSKLAKISRKNPDETNVLLSPVKTASPRKERSFGAHRRRFVVKVETDTQGSILDHLDVHSNVRQTFRDIIFRLHAEGTFTLSIKRDLLPTWHCVSLKKWKFRCEYGKLDRQYQKLTFWIIFSNHFTWHFLILLNK